ncbi:DUF2946 family protein [Roseateles sp.]|uniref:DUF2946 family protein n=1 Tax=Roseateles sp. TaxID=1971397 RepID=UPI0032654015
MPAFPHAFSRAHARRQSWWLLAVLVMGMLAPGISAALANARGDVSAWQDICRAPSLSGKASQPKPIEAALDLLAHGHCPACHISGAGLAGPPPVPALLLRDDLVTEVPARFWTAPVTGHAWRPASARAPPASI